MPPSKRQHSSVRNKAAKSSSAPVPPQQVSVKAEEAGATIPFPLAESLAHGEHVAYLAGKLLAVLAVPYGITAPWDLVLRTAARLHDAGWAYGQKGHHKMSAHMIRAGSVGTVEKNIRPLVALVARYHRRAEPSLRHQRFAALSAKERRGVRRMAAILRLADALDYSHAGLVSGIDVTIDSKSICLVLESSQGCAAEMDRIAVKKGLFRNVFKKDVVCRCKTQELPATVTTTSPELKAERPEK